MLVLEVAAARRGGSALGGDAIWATYKTGLVGGLQRGDMRLGGRRGARNTPTKACAVCLRVVGESGLACVLLLRLCVCVCVWVCVRIF